MIKNWEKFNESLSKENPKKIYVHGGYNLVEFMNNQRRIPEKDWENEDFCTKAIIAYHKINDRVEDPSNEAHDQHYLINQLLIDITKIHHDIFD